MRNSLRRELAQENSSRVRRTEIIALQTFFLELQAHHRLMRAYILPTRSFVNENLKFK